MAAPTDPRAGVTPHMSTEAPKPEHLKLDEALLQELKRRNEFEPTEDTNRRKAVLNRLEGVLKHMVYIVGQQAGLPPGILSEAGGKIFTYGSFQLGVYGPGSDVDTLMIAPKYVTREHFFQHVPALIEEEFKPEEIAEKTAVPGIAVPIIKLELCGVKIDLIFSSLQLSSVPKTQQLDDVNLLRGLNETDLKCVNGTRVTGRILELVPQTKVFRMALRAVKLWAKQRALYGAIVGFPGGVAYAMMVARICQLYPKAASPVIVKNFFKLMRMWKWPNPVLLQHHEEGPLNLREWDGTYGADKYHYMPVVTPAYPRINATHTIGPSTKTVLLREMLRAEKIVDAIFERGRPWSDLFQRHTFFTDAYRHYICVITASKTKSDQQAWSGLVESKVKWLIKGIEQSDANSVELVQPFNKGFNRVHECKTGDELERTVEGSLDFQIKEIKTQTTEEAADIKMQGAAQTDTDGKEVPTMNGTTAAPSVQGDGPQMVWTTTFYLGIGLMKGANSLDISNPIQEFRKQCQDWLGFNTEVHSIRVKHMRNYDLPGDVFEDGEIRPVRTKKTKAAAKNGAPATTGDTAHNKRSFSNAGLDENHDPAKRRQSANGASSTPRPNGTATPNGVAG